MSPIDIGYWRLPSGQRALLVWHPRTGQLILGQAVLAIIPTEVEMRRRLDGWLDRADTRTGLMWLAGRLEGCR